MTDPIAHMIPTLCPWCGRNNDAATGLDDDAPSAGDVSICFACAWPAIFVGAESQLVLRRPTPTELEEIFANPEVEMFRGAAARHLLLATMLTVREMNEKGGKV